jgi:hypothetical protein
MLVLLLKAVLMVVGVFLTDLPQVLIYVVNRAGPQSPARRCGSLDHEADDSVGQVSEIRIIQSK